MSSIFSRILVGIDDSEQARAAAAVAARLTREHGGKLVLCHAVRPDDASAEAAPAVLDAAAERAAAFDIVPQRRIFEGDAVNGIIRVADEMACRLIVVGTHRGIGVQQFLIGSITNAVLRASTLPVLTIGRSIKLAAETRRCFEHVLVATDNSEPSEGAVETALRLPPEDRRKLIFCCVADVDHGVELESATPERDDSTLGSRLTARAETIAGRALALARARGVAAESRVVEGNPGEALVAAALQEQADLIVLGSHGRRGMQRLLLGSVAETVVKTAPLPVLVVPISAIVGVTAKESRKQSSV